MAGLYVHIPFCLQKCRYCDFISFPGMLGALGAYIDVLGKEIQLKSKPWSDTIFNTVFFGGGTPSLLHHDQLAHILGMLHDYYSIASDAEITVEVNPGTWSRDKAYGYAAAGVNRVSVGLQAWSDARLKRIGRIHTVEDFVQTMVYASDAGIENINVDMMLGLPGQRHSEVSDGINAAVSMGAVHMSVYPLILEEGTRLYEDVMAGRENLPDEDAAFSMQHLAIARLAHHGFKRYEISNFARPGRECLHNVNTWKNGETLGLGLAAHSMRRSGGRWVRRVNPGTLEGYLCEEKDEVTIISREEEMFECIMLGLRMTQGIHLASFAMRFGVRLEEYYAEALKEVAAQDLIYQDHSYIRLTQRGMELQNVALMPFLTYINH